MKQSEITVWGLTRAAIQGVRYVAHGDAWEKKDSAFWPLSAAPAPEKADDQKEGAAPAAGATATVTAEESPLVRAVREARAAASSSDIVLSLPLSKLLVTVLKFPAEMADSLADAVPTQLEKNSPFPTEELSVSYEILGQNETELWVLAAALPEVVANELHSALEPAKVKVIKTDVTALGWFRSLCGACNLTRSGRHVLITDLDDGWDLIVVDNGIPVFFRNLGDSREPLVFLRELHLSLLNLELTAAPQPLEDVQIITLQPPDEAFIKEARDALGVPVTVKAPPSEDGGIEGVALRTGESAQMDLTPQPWRDAIRANRLRRRILIAVSTAAAFWVVLMGVLFVTPVIYRQLTERLRGQCRTHFRAYKQVSDTRERVNLIRSYMDRTTSPLEMLRLAASHLPDGDQILWQNISYRKGDGLRITGDAADSTTVLDYKDSLTSEPIFGNVTLVGPTLAKGRYKFDIDAKFKSDADTSDGNAKSGAPAKSSSRAQKGGKRK